jgi:hypothetical protein
MKTKQATDINNHLNGLQTTRLHQDFDEINDYLAILI